MNDRKRIEELEKKIEEMEKRIGVLEGRPYIVGVPEMSGIEFSPVLMNNGLCSCGTATVCPVHGATQGQISFL